MLAYRGEELNSFFGLTHDYINERNQLKDIHGLISIHWNQGEGDMTILIDEIPITLRKNQLTTTTYLQNVAFPEKVKALTTFTFNREFYCIQDHDHEVSCNGILFLGTQEPPVITLNDEEVAKFELLHKVFLDEFSTMDTIQGEMLRMLLKRLIIKTTRLAKQQLIPKELEEGQIDTVRKYNVLVDIHFREKHQVSEYAELLFKSPKTLSNLFAKYNQKTPLQIIHDRIVLEGKRLLMYTDKTVKEIAFDLGFEESGSFHKLFKKSMGQTPQQYKLAYKK